MIVYDLKCGEGHIFEAWFQNSTSFEQQAAGGHIECPLCGNNQISKSLMAPNIQPKKQTAKAPMPSSASLQEDITSTIPINFGQEILTATQKDESDEPVVQNVKRAMQYLHDAMKNYRDYVKKNYEYVGDKFADEARKMHKGEGDKKAIYGETTIEETQELSDEGVPIMPVPGVNKLDS